MSSAQQAKGSKKGLPAGLAGEAYAFANYEREDTKTIHRFYLDLFKGCASVVDLGCGRGEFLELLTEAGIKAVGVDLEPAVPDDAAFEVVRKDLFAFVNQAEAGRFDGAMLSHLVEHLEYGEALELFGQLFSILAPGGIVVVVVPNVAAIGHHLEWFHRDMTHAGFRHVETLSFLLHTAGFRSIQTGENPLTASPFLGGPQAELEKIRARLAELAGRLPATPMELAIETPEAARARITAEAEAAGEGGDGLARSVRQSIGRQVSRFLGRQLGPLVDRLQSNFDKLEARVGDLTGAYGALRAELSSVAGALLQLERTLDKAFEAYVVARKPDKLTHKPASPDSVVVRARPKPQ